MKVKNCIIILLFFITANIFARDFELLSINQDSDELNFSENLVQSQNAQGIEVSISPTTIVVSEIISEVISELLCIVETSDIVVFVDSVMLFSNKFVLVVAVSTNKISL